MAPSRISTVNRLMGSQLPRSIVICTLQTPSKDVLARALLIIDSGLASIVITKKHDKRFMVFRLPAAQHRDLLVPRRYGYGHRKEGAKTSPPVLSPDLEKQGAREGRGFDLRMTLRRRNASG